MTCTGDCPERPRIGLHYVNKSSDRCCDRDSEGVSVRTYFGKDVAAAIHNWGGFNGNSASTQIAMKLVAQSVDAVGEVVETFWIDQYVAVRFRDVTNKVGLYINKGNLDCVVPVPGSYPYKNGYHRIELGDGGSPSGGAAASPTRRVCTCGAQLPIVPGEFCDVCGSSLAN
jgi:hypothetical protein